MHKSSTAEVLPPTGPTDQALVKCACSSPAVWPAQVLESRVDHTRVVHLLRKADNLPLVKDYLLSVQKSNLAAVNEAVNELLVEEDNFEVLPCPPAAPARPRWSAHHASQQHWSPLQQ